MKSFRMFWSIIKRCKLHTFLIGFIICFFLFSVILWIIDPSITSFGNAIWYLFVACTSIGFGDIVAASVIGKILTVLLTIYEIVLVSIVSGVVVSFYMEVVHARRNETVTEFLDELTHLSELSKDELVNLENNVNEIIEKRKG